MSTSTSQATTLRGTVVSDKMDKTVVVAVQRFVKHPKYKKFYKITKKYKAHDENNVYKEGDRVFIQGSRPFSKQKTFIVVGPIEAGNTA